MTDRDRLIELYNESDTDCNSKECDSCEYLNTPNCMTVKFIDKILANGVMLTPCKVGQTVYELTTSEEIKRRKIKDIIYDNGGFRLRLEPYCSYEYYLNETVFLTPEEAKKALKERSS